jgi:tetratricopeptide (TPR) repeat protein
MAKVGRNDPCPCGSGKKYKQCCLAKKPSTGPIWALELDADPLEELTNTVVARIRQGNLDEAERLCRQLAEEYPDMIDPLDRYALLYEAKGDYQRAAEYCRRAASFAKTHEGFDLERIEDYLARARKLEAD